MTTPTLGYSDDKKKEYVGRFIGVVLSFLFKKQGIPDVIATTLGNSVSGFISGVELSEDGADTLEKHWNQALDRTWKGLKKERDLPNEFWEPLEESLFRTSDSINMFFGSYDKRKSSDDSEDGGLGIYAQLNAIIKEIHKDSEIIDVDSILDGFSEDFFYTLKQEIENDYSLFNIVRYFSLTRELKSINDLPSKESFDFTPYYERVKNRFTSKKRGDKLVGNESDENAYIDAYITVSKRKERAETFLENWFDIHKYGTILIYGEPGQGKTMLCNKATFDFWKGLFLKGKAKNVLTVSLNTTMNPRIIENKTVNLSNALVWGSHNQHSFSFEDCRGSLLFLDGFDEFISDAKRYASDVRNVYDFIQKLNVISKKYDIHIVVLSRTIAVSTNLDALSRICDHYKLCSLTHKQQYKWLDRHSEYSGYIEEFKNLCGDSRMKKILGIPFLFRLIVYNRFKISDLNTSKLVELYDNLFSRLMHTREIYGEDEQLINYKLMNLAFDIYCTDEGMCDLNNTNWDSSWTSSFFIEISDNRRIGFLHRSFYQYYLAKYIYREIINISEEDTEKTSNEKAEILISSFGERMLGSTVLEYLSYSLKKENELKIRTGIGKMENALSNAEALSTLSPRFNSGNAERSRTLRLKNIITNTQNIAAAFKYEIRTPFKEVIQINNFFEQDPYIYCSFDAFFDFLQKNNTEEIRKFISEELHYLFQISGTDNTIVPVHHNNKKLQQLLYHVWMIDTNRLKDIKIEPVSRKEKTSPISEPGRPLQDGASTSKRQENLSSELKPSYVEKATELVLKDFQQWLEKKFKKERLNCRIIQPVCYQERGDLFGNVVGMELQIEDTSFVLCFDCKEYTSNTQVKVNNKVIDISEYEIIFLKLYKDSINTETKTRWILVNPFGDLNNEFPMELFEVWNEEHAMLKIYPIIEKQSSPACREFFSANEEAYRLVYKENILPSVREREIESVFPFILDKIIGYDSVNQKIKAKLLSYPIPVDFINAKTSDLLPEQTDEGYDALQMVLSYLTNIKNNKSEIASNRKGIYIIGEYGTGKTWLLYRTIKEIINHPVEYPFEPVLMSLKDYGKNKKTMNERNIPTYAKEYVNSTINEYKKNGIVLSGCKSPLFLLDGFDEVLSGLSATNFKIKVLFAIVSELTFQYEDSKPVFIVTSRESDYHACHTNKQFIDLSSNYYRITLEDCSPDEVRRKLLAQAEKSEERKDSLIHLSDNQKILSLACRPVYYALLTRLVWWEESQLDYVVDEFSLLDEVIESEINRTIENMMGDNDDNDERKLRESLQEKLFECAVYCTQRNVNEAPFEWEDKEISETIPVGIFNVINKSAESAEQNSPWTFSTNNNREFWVSFLHNTVREFLVAKKHFKLLEAVNNGYGDNLFLDTLIRIQMSPASLRFFMTWIQNSSKREEYKNRITEWLCKKENKANSLLATRLLELVLQPDCTFGGDVGSLLDLKDIKADNLCIWNCTLQHIDLRGATLRNMQMTDTELVNIDFRGADLTGLQIAPMKPIIDLCQWKEEGEWQIAVLYQNGQTLQYSFTNHFTQGNYSIKILKQAESANGLIVLNRTKYWIAGNNIYSMEEQDEKALFQMESAKLIHQIIPRDKTNCIVVDYGDEFWVYACQHDAQFAYKLDRKDVDHFCMTDDGFLITANGKYLELVDSKMNTTRLCDLEEDFECFTIHQENNGENHIYIKYADKLNQVVYDRRFKNPTTMEFPIEGLTGTVQKIYAVKKGILAAISQSDLFILTAEDGRIRVDKVKTAVKISDIILENSDGTEKIKDQYAYELLSGSIVG